jgi:hypothetical protein
MMRCEEPGWTRIGPTGRRSLWSRISTRRIELCAGREGDDAYVCIELESIRQCGFAVDPSMLRALFELFLTAELAAEEAGTA